MPRAGRPDIAKPMTDLAPAFHLATPSGEDRERRVCDHCGFIDYLNPRIVVGSVVAVGEGADARVLMCRRAIQPGYGLWTLPAGYMETGEAVDAAARREAREEAGCELQIEGLLAIYDVPHIAQVQLMFRARLAAPGIAAGPESLEVALFAWDSIPWAQIAFPSVVWALNHWRAGASAPLGVPARNPGPDEAAARAPDGTAPRAVTTP